MSLTVGKLFFLKISAVLHKEDMNYKGGHIIAAKKRTKIAYKDEISSDYRSWQNINVKRGQTYMCTKYSLNTPIKYKERNSPAGAVQVEANLPGTIVVIPPFIFDSKFF